MPIVEEGYKFVEGRMFVEKEHSFVEEKVKEKVDFGGIVVDHYVFVGPIEWVPRLVGRIPTVVANVVVVVGCSNHLALPCLFHLCRFFHLCHSFLG